jgi:GT2 family glycosyltransferase
VVTTTTPADLLAARGNDHRPRQRAFRERTGLPWHAPTPAATGGSSLSVIIPAYDRAYSLPTVLDALAAQAVDVPVEVIVVDDRSGDGTDEIAAEHPVVDRAVRLAERSGAAAARNVGIALAQGETLVFLDADVVPLPHVLADFAARAADDLVLLGFREPVRYRSAPHGRAALPPRPPQLIGDHRVRWRAPVGSPAVHSGDVYTRPVVSWPLDSSADLAELGCGADRAGWDLRLMVVTALMAASRRRVCAVGGFGTAFGLGWGSEDAYLGAQLIASGCLVVPLRQALAFHIDPPDPAADWAEKEVTARERAIRGRELLAVAGDPAHTGVRAAELLAGAQRLR